MVLVLIMLSVSLKAQEQYAISGDYDGLSFKDFATRVENQLNVRFFYKDEWVKDIVVREYIECSDLKCILDKLFSDRDLFYYIDKAGNVVITKNYAVKITSAVQEDKDKFMAPTEYGDNGETSTTSGNSYVEIGNPAEKNMAGTVTLSGYITNKDTKDPVAG